MLRFARRLAAVCYVLVGVLALGAGLVYLTRPEFMPYHADAVGMSWGELKPELQTLLLALMRVAAGGFLAAAATVFVLLAIPFRRGQRWADFAIPGVSLLAAVPTLFAVILVRSRTPAKPPLGMAALEVALILLGFMLTSRPANKRKAIAETERKATLQTQ